MARWRRIWVSRLRLRGGYPGLARRNIGGVSQNLKNRAVAAGFAVFQPDHFVALTGKSVAQHMMGRRFYAKGISRRIADAAIRKCREIPTCWS